MCSVPARCFAKSYLDPAACQCAAANHRWLAGLPTALRLPRLLAATGCRLEFEHIDGRHATPADLIGLARALGDLHGAAHTTALHHARLDRVHVTDTGHLIPDFLSPRLPALRQRLGSGLVPDPRLDLAQATRLLHAAAAGPAALYKDANPRNFLLTAAGPVMVDADDLTLAPFGYDLAKLVVTLAMTHGRPSVAVIHHAMATYNQAADRHQQGLGNVSMLELLAWAEVHHILTSPYLGRHGFRYGWHTLRPTPNLHLQGLRSWP